MKSKKIHECDTCANFDVKTSRCPHIPIVPVVGGCKHWEKIKTLAVFTGCGFSITIKNNVQFSELLNTVHQAYCFLHADK